MRYPALLLAALLLAPGLDARAEDEAENRGLVIEASVSPTTAAAGDTLHLKATFRNDGPAPLEIYLPQHVGTVPFPSWRLVHESKALYVPHVPSFQSMWPNGLMGSILTLAPGESKSFTQKVTHVALRKDQRRSLEWNEPILLPAGRYRLRVVYEKKDDTVPWALPNFRSETRRHEGLWTGTIWADTGWLDITTSPKPTIHLTAPERVAPGGSYPVRVEIRHEGDEPIRVRGALVVRAHSKAYGGGSVRVLLRDEDWVFAYGDDTYHEVTFQPGTTRVVEVDLASLDLGTSRGGKRGAGGLYELIPVGVFHLDAAYRVKDEKLPLAAAGMFRHVSPLEPGSASGLALRLEEVKEKRLHPRVAVILENTGTETLHLPAHLVYPAHVFFSLRREGSTGRASSSVTSKPPSDPWELVRADDPGTRAAIEEGLSWAGGRWERRAPLGERSSAMLPPGGSIRRVFDLAELITTPDTLLHGSWIVKAYWQNRENGRRHGLEPALVVGMVESTAITIRGRGG